MCYSPTMIPNPNRFRKDRLSYVVDTKSQYIPVPCGHCGECIRNRTLGITQRAQLEELSGYPFFISLSYNPESLAYYECSNGYQIPYTPISDLQNMFKRLRKSNVFGRRFRYFAVSELGSKRGRPHAHILLFLEKLQTDSVYAPFNLEKLVWSAVLAEWRRNYGSTRNPVWKPLLTYIQRLRGGKVHSTYDCHYVQPSVVDGSSMDVAFYVSNYMLKDSVWREKLKKNLFGKLSFEEASEVWSKIKPRSISSLNFGFGIYDDINPRKVSKQARLSRLMCLEQAKIVSSAVERSSNSEKTPRYYDLYSGKPLPLARYWYKFGDIYTLRHHEIFQSRQDRIDGVSIDDRDISSKFLSEKKFVNNSKDSLTSNFDLLYAQS